MEVIDSNPQTRWRDSLSPSPQARLTLRANAEKKTSVIPPMGSAVQAGFDAPTVAPTVSDTTGGTYGTSDYVAYCYVYASSQYPFVFNIVTGGGELWPRSSPSPASSVHVAGGASKKYVVTVTKTTRSDVDYIWIYRTAIFTSSDEASNAAAAGEMFYIGRVANNGIAGTTTFTDDHLTDTEELLELDNYPAPTFQFCEFDGTYWWGIGNFSLDAEITVNGTAVVTLDDDDITQWFDGRNAQVVTIYGITSGGFDGKGSFYFKWSGPTTATMCSDEALTTSVVVPATGTTRIHVRGPGATLFRSKQLNPFSWGRTFENFNDDDTVSREPVLWAEPLGAGYASGIAILGNDSYLIVHLEEPTRTLRFTLSEAATENFINTQKNIDTQSSVGSHFSQFQARSPDGQTFLCGIDTKNFAVMVCDGEQQVAISAKVFQTMRSIIEGETVSRFFHGVYDARTELNCWWIKTTDSDGIIDRLVYQHAPTGIWGSSRAFGITASATIYDPQTKETFTLLGTENGHISRAFMEDVWSNDTVPLCQVRGTAVSDGESGGIDFTIGGGLIATYNSTVSGRSRFDVGTPHGLSVGDYVQLFAIPAIELIFDSNVALLPLTISPADVNGNTDGVVAVSRLYREGTDVTITAPTDTSGVVFSKWQKDNVDFSTNPEITVSADAFATYYAFYTSSYYILLRGAGSFTAADSSSGSYMLPLGGSDQLVIADDTPTDIPPSILWFIVSDYPGLVTLRLRVQLIVGATAPTVDFTFALYEVGRPASQGLGGIAHLLGSMVTGSSVTATTPAANSHQLLVSDAFSPPVTGTYVMVVTTSGAMAANTFGHVHATLEASYP